MIGLPDNRSGGTNSYKNGCLKKRLDPVVIAILSPTTPTNGNVQKIRVVLKGLSGDLNVNLLVAPVGVSDSAPLEPSASPAGMATMQLTPVVYQGNQPKIFLRPVFQDPFAVTPNSNNPLPQDIPFGWEFSTEADEVYVDVVINGGLVVGLQAGSIVVQATVEYNGQWWDTKAIQAALGQVQLIGVSNPVIVGSQNS